MQISEKNKSWYEYPLVWMVIAIPFSAMVMGVIMIYLAIDTSDGLVVDDYYKQGLEINQDISRDKKAHELGLSAIVEFDNSARILRVKFDKGLLDTYPKSLQLNLQHATRENSDIVAILDHGIDDQYIGHVKQSITQGVWYFQIVDENWKLKARSYVGPVNVIELRSAY